MFQSPYWHLSPGINLCMLESYLVWVHHRGLEYDLSLQLFVVEQVTGPSEVEMSVYLVKVVRYVVRLSMGCCGAHTA